MALRDRIHNTSFSSLLKDRAQYFTSGWKGFPGTNTLAYWAQISKELSHRPAKAVEVKPLVSQRKNENLMMGGRERKREGGREIKR